MCWTTHERHVSILILLRDTGIQPISGLDWRPSAASNAGDRSPFDLEQGVKPASNIAEHKSVGAMIVLKSAMINHFRDVTGFWVTELMQKGRVYKEVATGRAFLSLGCFADGGLSWELTEVGNDGKFFQLSNSTNISERDAAKKLDTFATSLLYFPGKDDSASEDYAGIPTRVCIAAAVSICVLRQVFSYNDCWMSVQTIYQDLRIKQ